MWIAWIIFTSAAALAVIIGIAILLFTVWRLTRLPLRRCSFSFIDRSAMPEEENSKLAGAEEFLLGEGFAYSFSVHLPQAEVDIPGKNERYLNVYHHAESDAYAIASHIAALARYSIVYVNCFSDGTHWQTYNQLRHYTIELDTPHVFDDYLPDDATTWRAHQKRISDSGKQPARDKNLAMQTIREEETGLIDRMLKRGALKPIAEERWRLTWFFALRCALAVIAGSYKENLPPSATAETVAEAFLRRKETSQYFSSGKKHKGKIFVATSVLFLLFFGWLFDWVTSFVLFFVLLLHELGHLLAMRAFGYKNTSILFLPGLGALTVGEKKNAPPFQRLIIYLAGPMPGLLLSGMLVYGITSTQLIHTLAHLFYDRWIITAAVFSLLVNYMNLLPVFPLDGGRVVEMLAFSRFPRGRLVFIIAGCLIIFLAAFMLNERILMILGILLAIGLPTQWKLTKIRLTIGKKNDKIAQTEEEAAQMTFEALSQPGFAKWSLNKRIELADVLIGEYMERQPSGWEILLGVVVYLLCLALPALYAFVILEGIFI